MARFFRLSLLLVVAGMMASTAVANVPDPIFSDLPDKITVFPALETYPGPREWNEMTIKGNLGVGVAGANIDIVFEDAAALLCWCNGQAQPVVNGTADGSGYAYFEIYAGGCLEADLPDVNPVRIVADGITMRRVTVNSPDVVDDAGVLAADGWAPGGTCIVKGNDGVYHTPNIVNNSVDACSKFDQDTAVTDIVNSTDAVILTPFVVNNSSCTQAP
jgi:hypothetical protein